MKTVATLAAVFLLLATLLSVLPTLLPTHGEEEIYDAVIRLHVLAASDSVGDQQNKLAVRDAILPVAAAALEGCESRAAAAEMSLAVRTSMTGSVTPASTIAGISSGITLERICTGIVFP